VRHHSYSIALDGTSIKVYGDKQFLFAVDLLQCLPPGGCYRVMVEVAQRNDMHEAAKSALSRAIDELLSDVFLYEERTGEKKLHLDRWSDEVSKAFSRDASRYQ
jgi:hypothetical protein